MQVPGSLSIIRSVTATIHLAKNHRVGSGGQQYSLTNSSMLRDGNHLPPGIVQDSFDPTSIIPINHSPQHHEAIPVRQSRFLFKKAPCALRECASHTSVDSDSVPWSDPDVGRGKEIPSRIGTEPFPGIGRKLSLDPEALYLDAVGHSVSVLHWTTCDRRASPFPG